VNRSQLTLSLLSLLPLFSNANDMRPLREYPPGAATISDAGFDAERTQSSGSTLNFAKGEVAGRQRIDATAEEWGEATHFTVDLDYQAQASGKYMLLFFARGENQPRLVVRYALVPDTSPRLVLPLSAFDAQQLFLARTPGVLKVVVAGQPVARRDLSHVLLGLQEREFQQSVQVRHIALWSAEPPARPFTAAPIIDELGQSSRRTWPGKTPDGASLVAALKNELHAAHPEPPAEQTRWGGVSPVRREGTGHFRLLRDGARWWLVDPDGGDFFSLGMDVVQPGSASPILPGMEAFYASLPAAADADHRSVNFISLNLQRAFGADWMDRWRELTERRLVDWRFNTIGAWADRAFLAGSQLPRTVILDLGRRGETTPRLLFRDFPDVFSPAYRLVGDRVAASIAPQANDPRVIGYFLTNEPHWGFGRFNLAREMLKREPGSSTRRELARWLDKRYQGDVGKWREAWGRSAGDFGAVRSELFDHGENLPQRAMDDLWSFSAEMVREWVRVPSEACRAAAPKLLNLGVRYAFLASDLLLAGGEYFDVFSINNYADTPPLSVADRINRELNKPLLIGEFHFGALDRGLSSAGLQVCANQEQRARAYRYYVERAASHPGIVGVHYFQLNDQPLLGRGDGENYQIGFVDVCQRPYPEIVAAAREAHANVRALHAGEMASQAPAAKPKPFYPD